MYHRDHQEFKDCDINIKREEFKKEGTAILRKYLVNIDLLVGRLRNESKDFDYIVSELNKTYSRETLDILTEELAPLWFKINKYFLILLSDILYYADIDSVSESITKNCIYLQQDICQEVFGYNIHYILPIRKFARVR